MVTKLRLYTDTHAHTDEQFQKTIKLYAIYIHQFFKIKKLVIFWGGGSFICPKYLKFKRKFLLKHLSEFLEQLKF